MEPNNNSNPTPEPLVGSQFVPPKPVSAPVPPAPTSAPVPAPTPVPVIPPAPPAPPAPPTPPVVPVIPPQTPIPPVVAPPPPPVASAPAQSSSNLFWILLVGMILIGGAAAFYIWQSRIPAVAPVVEEDVIVSAGDGPGGMGEEKMIPQSLSDADKLVLEKLALSDFTLEYVGPQLCGEGPCPPPRELGWFALEKKPGGYRINLSTTLLAPYFTDPDKGTLEQMSKIGSKLYFTSKGQQGIYELNIKEKQLTLLYRNPDFYPVLQGSFLTKPGMILTALDADPNNGSGAGMLVAVDISSTTPQVKTYAFNVFNGVDASVQNLFVLAVDDIYLAQGNPDLVWIIPRFEEIEPKYPVINLKSGMVEYKSRSQMIIGDQPAPNFW